MRLKLLDLFSGIGGFSLGLERSGGFETVAFCEIDAFCRRVLAQHWPGVPCYDDVRSLTADALSRDGITVDAVCGGFPCQDISLAGKGGGLDGQRSGLWREYARLIRELRPRFVLVENVAALLGRGMGVVLGQLSELGYDAVWRRIAAADVGAPHLRQRIWIVAYARGLEHEGLGDAIWRAIAAELARAAADAFGDELWIEPGRLGWPGWTGSPELADDGRAGAVADADCDFALEPRRDLGEVGRRLIDGGATLADAGLARLSPSERAELCRARRRDEGRAIAECDRRPAQPGLGRVADGLSDRLDAHPGWRVEPQGLPRVARGVAERVGRLKGLGNAVVPQIPEMIGRAIAAARMTT